MTNPNKQWFTTEETERNGIIFVQWNCNYCVAEVHYKKNNTKVGDEAMETFLKRHIEHHREQIEKKQSND